jgi:hypothetical protein
MSYRYREFEVSPDTPAKGSGSKAANKLNLGVGQRKKVKPWTDEPISEETVKICEQWALKQSQPWNYLDLYEYLQTLMNIPQKSVYHAVLIMSHRNIIQVFSRGKSSKLGLWLHSSITINKNQRKY